MVLLRNEQIIAIHEKERTMKEILRTALITGGTKGIGLGVAEMLIKEGYKVAITCLLYTSRCV